MFLFETHFFSLVSRFPSFSLDSHRIEYFSSEMTVEVDVDKIITMLLDVKKEKPGTQVNLPAEWIRALCQKAQECFMSQPMLLRLAAPIQICGVTLLRLLTDR